MENCIELHTFPDDETAKYKSFTVEKEWLIDVLERMDSLNDRLGVDIENFLENYCYDETDSIFQMAMAAGKLISHYDVFSSDRNNDGSIVGELFSTDKDGTEILKVIKAPYNQGVIYKNPLAYKRKVGICYVPENDTFVSGYDYNDFLEIAEGNEEIADYLFDTVDWQHPETLFDENIREGEFAYCPSCGKLYMSYNKPICDDCKRIEEAKALINDFVAAEYDSDSADFSDLSNVGIAYTTTEDELHEIQASVDLVNNSIVKKVDGIAVETEHYDTIDRLINVLKTLDFSELTTVTIPDSVTSIGVGVFEGCISLKIPD